MASIFKQQYTEAGKDGERIRKKSKYWYIDYRVAEGIRKRVKGYKDKQATLQLAAKLEREAEFADVGMTDKYEKYRKTPLKEHLADYRESLKVGNTVAHVKVTHTRVKRVFDDCGFQYWPDIQPSKVKNCLGKMDIKAKTFNHYLTALKMFGKWMVQDGRASESPFGCLSRLKVEDADRRPLSVDEVCRLLESTERAPTRFGMTGHERAALYLLAIETGLRVRELQSLTVESFDFDDCTVTAKAEFCKDRKKAVQLLKCSRAGQLRGLFRGKIPKVKAFNMPSNCRTAKMLRADLEAAGIPVVDDEDRKVVFHSLRHTLATELDRSGATLKERMTIMRHSDRQNLTLGVYTKARLFDIRRAIENLPDYPWPGTEPQTLAATGTGDVTADSAYKPAYKKLAKNPYFGRQQSTIHGIDMGSQIEGVTQEESFDKSLAVAHLGIEQEPMSSTDTGSESNGPGRIRTSDQWIMSPLL